MSHVSLTIRYRPQTFADLAGQATLKAILSRAVSEDRIAPAYLFSGTRGVGKTTIARIFAKALNCRQPVKTGAGTEPCNACDQCRAVTHGSSVDVVEIDGASNRGIDDVRKLKESVGYAPMEGRYKIFIIDEAHMLSREAFNALLKTLEEPPARVTFIMATTEPHKFPITIISRCQHYVFKRLSDAELEAHLKKVLAAEQQPYEEAAVRLLTRRAAGSVRDAMSLLGQVLALGGETLAEADARAVLGLAGQELFFKLLDAIRRSDCGGLSLLVRDMLDQGVDLGFFLRELTAMWRNLFMLRQVGAEAAALVELPEAEAARWLAEARELEISHIHACWQLTLEGQRRVLTSLEPALALELLLLNLAMLPRLMSVEQLSTVQRRQGAQNAPADTLSTAEKKSPLIETAQPDQQGQPCQPDQPVQPSMPVQPTPSALSTDKLHNSPTSDIAQAPRSAGRTDGQTDGFAGFADENNLASLAEQAELDAMAELGESDFMESQGHEADPRREPPPTSARPDSGSNQSAPGDWQEFLGFCATDPELAHSLTTLFGSLRPEWSGRRLRLTPPDGFTSRRLEQKNVRDSLSELLRKFCGFEPLLEILPAPEAQKSSHTQIREEVEALPIVQALKESLQAELIDCGPWYR